MAKSLVVCEYCGKEFFKYNYSIKKTKHNFCSKKCCGSARKSRILIKCDYCGVPFEQHKYRENKFKTSFCSDKCHGLFKSKKNVEKSIGKKYGELTVISLAYINRESYVNCKCSCGNQNVVALSKLKSGKTKTCGSCIPDKERFMSFVSVVNDNTWLWIGSVSSNGYGQFRYKNKTMRAHRVSYLIFNGEIPEGMCVCHGYDDNPLNVCPKNLWLGSQKDNMRDMIEKGRQKNSKL